VKPNAANVSNEEIQNTQVPLTQARFFAVFDPKSPTDSLSGLSLQLLEEQKQSWPQLAQGYASLATVKLRELQCDGYRVFLQFNPGRIVSTGAKVDERSIRERPCFLCVENLPQPQKGILYGEEFLVLCNPAPIFREHLTISNVNHIPQAIGPFLDTFLSLARDLSPGFSLFYNGARCGASAPDHMHFQANPSGAIPVEKDSGDTTRRELRKRIGDVSLFSLERYGRRVLVLECASKEALQTVLRSTIASIQRLIGTSEEPLLNILASYEPHIWRVILFPRDKHRPDAYFKEGKERILISPAAVDIGGLVITPLERDFESVDAGMIERIFAEVSIEQQMFEEMIEGIRA